MIGRICGEGEVAVVHGREVEEVVQCGVVFHSVNCWVLYSFKMAIIDKGNEWEIRLFAFNIQMDVETEWPFCG